MSFLARRWCDSIIQNSARYTELLFLNANNSGKKEIRLNCDTNKEWPCFES